MKERAKMELNREQIRYKMSEKHIIRALECLSKPNSSPADREKCYFMWKEPSCLSCYHEVAQNALALIKELTEENTKLQKAKDENERLRADKETLYAAKFPPTHEDWAKLYRMIVAKTKADTVRQMQERLTTFFASDDTLNHIDTHESYGHLTLCGIGA